MADITIDQAEWDAVQKKLKGLGEQANKASGYFGGLGGAIGKLYGTVSDSNARLQSPFTQTGKALGDVAGVAKALAPSLLGANTVLGDFIDVGVKAGSMMLQHTQKLNDFSTTLAGSASLSINSFTELQTNLSSANLTMSDFTTVQATATNFLSSMGGTFRDVSGQAKLLSDITNQVNDDFDELGQMGLSVADKQSLMAETMELSRQIGLKSSDDASRASQIVSGAMQNMAMESNKMAALTGKDRRESLESMKKRATSDQDVLVSAKMIADQQGLTAEQTINLRTGLAAVQENVANAFPGGMGQDMQAAIDLAARTGMDFETALGKLNPQLAVALSKNKEFTDGMDAQVKVLREGGEVDVAELGDLNKKFESSVDKNYLTTLQYTEDGKQLSNDMYNAMVTINAQSVEAAETVETDTAKLKESSAGQVANMAQVAKDTLAQAENAAAVWLTMGTEVFNDQFADNAKTIRDHLKDAGTAITESAKGIRDDLLGSRTLSAETSEEIAQYVSMGLTDAQATKTAIAERLKFELEGLGYGKEAVSAMLATAGVTDESVKVMEDKLRAQKAASVEGMQEMSNWVKEQEKITGASIERGADAMGVPVDALTAQVTAQNKVIEASEQEQAETQGKYIDAMSALSSVEAAQMMESVKQMQLISANMADASYDTLISDVIAGQENMGAGAEALLQDIKEQDNSQEIINGFAQLNTEGVSEEAAHQETVIRKLEELIELFKIDSTPADNSGSFKEIITELKNQTRAIQEGLE